MGEFKVGDRVRYHDENVSGIGVVHELARDGVYLVNVETKDLDWAYYVQNTCREFAERNLTPVAIWQPKVGDRVRYSGKSTIYSDAELIGLEGVVTNVGTELATVKWDKEVVNGIRTGGDKYIANIEPIATLTIEAGKFYKTRDGRKVGPMEEYSGKGLGHSVAFGQTAAFTAPDLEKSRDGGSYTTDGTWLTSSGKGALDLIAEWVDEPVDLPAKASNDNVEPAAKPKFKVGDRVKTKGWARFYEIAEVEGTDIHVILYDGTTSKEYTEGREFEFELTTPAIVALIEDGTAKPATRPKVHADQASATTEAERLALQFPGQQFGVFVLADSKIADVVNVPTAVLRSA